MRGSWVLFALALVGCGSAVPPPSPPVVPAPPAPAPLPELPGAEAWIRTPPWGRASPIVVAAHETTVATGPIATTTLALTLGNPASVADEAPVGLRLPPGAVVGRLALDVDGRWMEGEVMPHAAATRVYNEIVHPEAAPRRDPALLVAGWGREWTLDVFPVPAAGERHVEIVYHRLIGAAPGTGYLVPLPPSMDVPGWAFAIAPRFDREVADPAPVKVVIALDTSLSLGKVGLGEAIVAARAVAAARPDATLVVGDLHPRVCASSVDSCLGALDAGGATDLGALLDAAFGAAGDGPAAIVLVSDGLPTTGASGEALRRLIEDRVAGSATAVHTLSVGHARSAVLDALAEAGLGAADGDPTQMLAAGRRPRYDVDGATSLEVVTTARGPILLGRLATRPSELTVRRTDGGGTVRAAVTVAATDATTAAAIPRVLGARLLRHLVDPTEAAPLARAWGIATADASMLALERDDDYAARGIARYKAAERAVEQGLPPPVIGAEARDRDRAFQADVDGDGLPDALDRCPEEAETYNGYQDDDGCPDAQLVRIEAEEIRILERIYFERGKTLLRKEGLPILDEVAQVMREHPELTLVALEGHRDPREPARGDLGRRRAEAARSYLIRLGVESSRLIAIDRGATQPITPGRTAGERAQNRRVEFRLLLHGDLTRDVLVDLSDEEAKALIDNGRPRGVVEAALARSALARHDQPAAAAALARALEATAAVDQRLAIFTADLAAGFPDQQRAAVRAAALAGLEPADADADRFYDALAHLPAGDADPLRVAAERWLARLADPDVRWMTSPARLEVSARLLAWLGRADEAERRRSETLELAGGR